MQIVTIIVNSGTDVISGLFRVSLVMAMVTTSAIGLENFFGSNKDFLRWGPPLVLICGVATSNFRKAVVASLLQAKQEHGLLYFSFVLALLIMFGTKMI